MNARLRDVGHALHQITQELNSAPKSSKIVLDSNHFDIIQGTAGSFMEDRKLRENNFAMSA